MMMVAELLEFSVIVVELCDFVVLVSELCGVIVMVVEFHVWMGKDCEFCDGGDGGHQVCHGSDGD